MSESKHTPGPWIVEQTTLTISAEPLKEGRARVPVSMTVHCSQADANARLIAAAPDLLEACEFFFGAIESGEIVRDISRDGEPDWALRMVRFTAKLGKAQAVIAKAEGQLYSANQSDAGDVTECGERGEPGDVSE